MGDTDHDEFGFYQERLLSDRLTRFFVSVIFRLFLWAPMDAIWSFVIFFLYIFVFSSPIRHAGIGIGLDGILVIAMILGIVAAAMLIPERFYGRIFYGRPWFGKLSKFSKSYVATLLRATTELSFKLDDDNKQLMQRLADLNYDEWEWSMGRQYRILHSDHADDGTVDIEAQWNNVWQERVLKTSSGGRTFEQMFGPDSYSSVTVPHRLTGVVSVLSTMTALYEIAVLWILLSRLESGLSLLPVFQVAIAFSVAMALVAFLTHNYKISDMPIFFSREILQVRGQGLMPKARRRAEEAVRELEKEFGGRYASLRGKKVSVIEVKVSPRYFSLIRNYYARSVAYESVRNSLTGLALVAVAIAFLLVFGVENEPDLRWLYTRLAIALALMPATIAGINFLIFTMVAQFRRFTALLITGGIIAFIPLVANYLFTGRLPASPVAFVSSAIVALIGSAGADLALQSRKRITDRPAKDQ